MNRSPSQIEASFCFLKKLVEMASTGGAYEYGDSVRLLDKAFQTMHPMQQQGVPMWRDMVYLSLQGCLKNRDLAASKRVHSVMVTVGLDSTAILGDHLIRLFTLCGSLLEVNVVFCKISKPSVYTWHAVISAHAMFGEYQRVLELYYQMQKEGIKPSKFTSSCILKSCGNIMALGQGKMVHDEIIKSQLESDVVVGSSLIDMYAKCGSLEEAQKVFDGLRNRNEVSWNVMIAGHAQYGYCLPALYLFEKMQNEGINPGKVTFLCVLKACGGIRAVLLGQQVHHLIIKSSIESDVAIGSALVDMYAKCGSVEEARKVFDQLNNRNAVTWGAMISGYAEHGYGYLAFELFEKLQQEGFQPDKVLFSCVLKGCGTIGATKQGKMIHDQIIRGGLKSDVVLASILIDMYAKCGSLEDARKVFDELDGHNVVSSSAMMSGYSEHGNGHAALKLFDKMQQQSIKPDRVTLLCLLKACGSLPAIGQGQLVHGQIIRTGLESDVVMGSTLIDMYAKCGSLEDACKVLKTLPGRNAVTWGALISGYAQLGLGHSALQLFESMQEEGIKPGKATFLHILRACGSMGAILQGKLIHEQLIGSKVDSDVSIGNTLVDMYVKCGALEEAYKVFNDMAMKDVVSWGAMITGCVQYSHGLRALWLFENMLEEGVRPDFVIFSCILKACCIIGAVGQGQLIHEQIMRNGLELDVVVGNTLVNLYAKCGSLEEARHVFDRLCNRNVESWNAMIAAYAEHGMYRLAAECFHDMQLQGLKPGGISYTSILTACSHAGQVEEGWRYFKSMVDNNITPGIEHFNCVVDIFSRAGHLNEAEEFLQSMPIPPDVASWTSLLTACRVHNNVELGRKCFEQGFWLHSDTASGYVLMSSIFANSQMWGDVIKLQTFRQYFGVWKIPGRACLEINHKNLEFIAGDKTHPQSDKIFAKLKRLRRSTKEQVYLPLLTPEN